MELFIGYIAALLTTISFFPQALRVIKTKDTHNISLGTYFLFTVGLLFWTIYGIMLKELPIIAANVVTLIPAITILMMKLKYK